MAEIDPIDYSLKDKTALSDNQYLIGNIRTLLAIKGTAILNGDKTLSKGIINLQIDELIRNGIIPMAFVDRPIERAADLKVNNHFSTAVKEGRVPFEVYDDKFKTTFFTGFRFPEKTDKEKINNIYKAASKRLVLRDAVFGIAININSDQAQAIEFIRHLKRLGYGFVDLRLMPNYVRSEDSLVFSKPVYFAKLANDKIVYANKEKLDLIKFKLNNRFLSEQLLGPRFKVVSEAISSARLSGTALIDIPARDGVLVLRQVPEKPSQVKKYQKDLRSLFLGKTSTGVLDDVNRMLIWLVFLVTIVVLLYLVNILIFQVKSKKYREI
jgi:hypothetical protein